MTFASHHLEQEFMVKNGQRFSEAIIALPFAKLQIVSPSFTSNVHNHPVSCPVERDFFGVGKNFSSKMA
jgi:hypothetical protein